METAKRIMHGVRRFAWVGLFWLLCIFCAMPANAQAAQNTYYYPGYDAAANGPINLMQYIKSITLTVNGQEYTPELNISRYEGHRYAFEIHQYT